MSRPSGFDARTITVQTASLFNQRAQSRLAKESWKGDWVFRRARLELIDKDLRDAKPDMLIFQEAMQRKGSSSESDRDILLAGSLGDYEWYEIPVREFEDTHEVQTMALAVGLPLRILKDKSDAERELWMIGNDGYLVIYTVDLEGQPITVCNLQMPRAAKASLWYTFVQDVIAARLKKYKGCAKRLLVSGFLPTEEIDMRRFTEFMNTFQLKDASTGFCEVANKCYTSTPSNDLFLASVGDETPAQTDRILVHQNAFVYSSQRNFNSPMANERYHKIYGISRLWPTQRFGWLISARFPKCTDDDL